jgi:hypothetical protein
MNRALPTRVGHLRKNAVKPSSLLAWLKRLFYPKRSVDVPRILPVEERWACSFECSKPLLEVLSLLNAAGPWRWHLRDKEAFGDYLACGPRPGLSVRLYDLDGYDSNGPTYTVDFERRKGCELGGAAVEAQLREHLKVLGASKIAPTAYWD